MICYCGTRIPDQVSECSCCKRKIRVDTYVFSGQAPTFAIPPVPSIPIPSLVAQSDKFPLIQTLSGYSDNLPDTIAQANKLGYKIVAPLGNQLFIDIDSDEQMEQFAKVYPILRNHLIAANWCKDMAHRAERSPSGELFHYHVTVTISFTHPSTILTDVGRIALQSILGSDPMREALSFVRCAKNEPQPTVFFEKP